MLLGRGFDRADVVAGLPNGPGTRFRIASLTKQFTGLAVLILQEQGKLLATGSVCAHVPSCPPHWQPITLDHLLTHTAGLCDHTSDLTRAKQLLAAIGSEHPNFTDVRRVVPCGRRHIVRDLLSSGVRGEDSRMETGDLGQDRYDQAPAAAARAA